jgi:hypothetical protein
VFTAQLRPVAHSVHWRRLLGVADRSSRVRSIHSGRLGPAETLGPQGCYPPDTRRIPFGRPACTAGPHLLITGLPLIRCAAREGYTGTGDHPGEIVGERRRAADHQVSVSPHEIQPQPTTGGESCLPLSPYLRRTPSQDAGGGPRRGDRTDESGGSGVWARTRNRGTKTLRDAYFTTPDCKADIIAALAPPTIAAAPPPMAAH